MRQEREGEKINITAVKLMNKKIRKVSTTYLFGSKPSLKFTWVTESDMLTLTYTGSSYI
jgi:hypothetical protein